jgi:GNAT superfamily N-acetyltransferase
MSVTIRRATPADADACGRICYAAFKKIAEDHNFPCDFPDVESAIGVLTMMFGHPGVYAVVAERDGVAFATTGRAARAALAGIGPITVAPDTQNAGVGRQLMQHMIDRVAQRRGPGVRLVQSAYHNRSLSLYAKLGFAPREPLSCVQGPPIGAQLSGYAVRPATAQDLDACNQLCLRVHGHTRDGEVREAIQFGTAVVVEHRGRITGYATGLAFFAHAVGEANADLEALIASAPVFAGPGLLVPTRNGDLLRWCLNHGLRIVQPMTLMSIGLYNEPQGVFLPSIAY